MTRTTDTVYVVWGIVDNILVRPMVTVTLVGAFAWLYNAAKTTDDWFNTASCKLESSPLTFHVFENGVHHCCPFAPCRHNVSNL
jgi:hypothetical protein